MVTNDKLIENLLVSYGAQTKKVRKNEIIFYEDDKALFYYQVVQGSVKMINLNNEGKEFIQGIFKAGQSFGEPPLFLNKNYPATAVSLENTIVLILNKDVFLKMLNEHSNAMQQMLKILSQRLYSKSNTIRELIHNTAEEKILAYLREYKKLNGPNSNEPALVNHTRQEIANLTGLRVETVIRCIKKLEESGKVKIIQRKLFF